MGPTSSQSPPVPGGAASFPSEPWLGAPFAVETAVIRGTTKLRGKWRSLPTLEWRPFLGYVWTHRSWLGRLAEGAGNLLSAALHSIRATCSK